MSKPSFEQFHVALLHDSERKKYGIPLDTVGAFQILRDESTMRKYYQAWTPTFGANQRPRSRMSSAEQKRRTAVGWAMLLVILAVSAVVVFVAGDALLNLINGGAKPGGIVLPDWLQFKPW